MTIQLSLRGISKSYRDEVVLDRVDLVVAPGERIGVVGENGSGKSTLLRLAAGIEPPDEGSVQRHADGGTGYLGQVLDLPGSHTVGQAVDVALADLRAIWAELRELETDLTGPDRMARYGALLTSFELRDGYQADARVDKALHALGLAHVERIRRLDSLSGGELARLALACVLAAAPELLLLDEPTNHLDADAAAWLEDRLRSHRGTVVAVSHDRQFLTRVATSVVEVGNRTLTRYGNGYAGYLAGHAAARAHWEQRYARWCDEVRDLTAFAATTAREVAPGRAMSDNNKLAYDRAAGRVQSSVASRVRNAQQRLHRLTEDPVPQPPEPLRFTGRPAGGGAEGLLLEVDHVRVADRLAVDELSVSAGTRLLVHGPNGAGKSTLLRLLAGELVPDSGTVRRRGRYGYLPQETAPDRSSRSLLAAFAHGRPGSSDEHRAALLGLGLFAPQTLTVPVCALSVGQRQRLALARLLVTGTDLLLLDEPTNHLSVTLAEELEQALADYPGALILVSHDRALRSRFAGRRVDLSDGRIAS